MDLPTCPSCKQSVLDDDAVDCPFCGAPMKGGAAPARSAPPKAAPKSSPAAKPQPVASTASKPIPAVTKSAPTAPKASKPETTDEDDPFAVDQSASASAIPVSAKSGGPRTLEVKCPMCETVGYVSPKAAGQAVKCCNPQCLVPVFTAPAPEKKPAPPPPPPPKKPIALYAAIGGTVVAAIAVGLYFAFGNPQPDPSIGQPISVPGKKPVDPGTSVADGDPTKTSDKTDNGKNATNPPEVDPAKARQEVIKQSLRDIVSAALGTPDVRKAYSRRLSALAYLDSGNEPGAREQLDQLQVVGKQTPYEAIFPTIELAWKHAAEPAEFAKRATEAQQLAEKLPPRGRFATEAAVGVATLLAASGKQKEAHQLLTKHSARPDVEQLAASLRLVEADATFNLDAPLIGRSLGQWDHPLETAVTLILFSRGRIDDAFAWADKSTDPSVRVEALLVWAESFARRGAADNSESDLKRAADIANGLPPAPKARLLARIAKVQLDAGHRPEAEDLLRQADESLKTVTPPTMSPLPTAKSILDLKLPESASLRQAAEAAADIAVLKAELGQKEQAWESARTALAFLKGLAPSLSFAQQKIADLEGSAADAIRDELKKVLQLKNEDQIRRSVTQYRQKCQDVLKAANIRIDLEKTVLLAAVNAGLVDQAWDEIQVADGKTVLEERQPLIGTIVPLVISARYAAAGQADKAKVIRDQSENRVREAFPASAGEFESADLVENGRIPDALQELTAFSSDTGILHEWSLRLGCRLVSKKRVADALQLALGLKDTPLREDGLRLISALAARSGHAEDVSKFLKAKKLQPTETAAVLAGLIAGLTRGNK